MAVFQAFLVFFSTTQQERRIYTFLQVIYEDDDKLLSPMGCTICGNSKCQRHRPEVARVKLQPWVGMNCPESVDIALDEFLSLVLKDFVYGWYSDLSSDDTFVDELRTSLRYIASVLVRRVRKLDIPTLVTEKLLKEGLKHFDSYTKAKEKVKQNEGTENLSSVLKLLEPDMHCALHSRTVELLYLRKVADGVLPHLLPPQSLKCRSLIALLRELLSGAVLLTLMDKLSDPDFVNSLWLVFLDKQAMVASNQPPSSRIPFLKNFARSRAPLRNSALHLSLGEILHSQTALFPFMQFMRKEAALNVLQFCLTIEDFNKRYFAPDVSPEEELSLIKEANEMYNSYFDINAVDRINFQANIVDGLKNSIAAPVNKMERLKMAALLSKAYEHAYNLLEGTFIPLFYQSDDYFSLLCGSRLPARPLYKPTSRASKKKFDPLAEFSKLAGKIKHKVLNPVREEYSAYDELDPYDMIETPPEFALDSDEEVDNASLDEQSRDLSTWKITIPHVIMENKYKCIYIISVERTDAKDGKYLFFNVKGDKGRYKEFYVLQSKLEEFHGAIENTFLPVKQSSSKMASTKKPATYYESCRDQFENYLQVLSRNPLLKCSALLFYFLSPNKEFLKMFESKNRKGNIAGTTHECNRPFSQSAPMPTNNSTAAG
ncbi:hypothetical protein QZH41_015164 [Actinostola sp. cb2023]|nr:hypothetical protein QZH41_015164 [Actinostola sp. cb2023]